MVTRSGRVITKRRGQQTEQHVPSSSKLAGIHSSPQLIPEHGTVSGRQPFLDGSISNMSFVTCFYNIYNFSNVQPPSVSLREAICSPEFNLQGLNSNQRLIRSWRLNRNSSKSSRQSKVNAYRENMSNGYISNMTHCLFPALGYPVGGDFLRSEDKLLKPFEQLIWESALNKQHAQGNSSNMGKCGRQKKTKKAAFDTFSHKDPVPLAQNLDPQSSTSYADMHNEDASGQKCLRCKRTFCHLSALIAHNCTYSDLKNKCMVCGRMFSRSWLLKGHMRTHTGERPYKCTHYSCDRAFADKSNLRSHMLIHTVKTKNFFCEKCGRAFAQKRYLHKHKLEVCQII